MVMLEFAELGPNRRQGKQKAQSAVSDAASAAAVRLPRTCRTRVETTAAITASTTTIVNGVHGKCCVVNSLTKFFDDCTGSPFLATSWPASSVTRSKCVL